MWYLGCLFVLIIFLLSCAYVGAAVCRLLPWRIRPYATLAFAPVLGLAVFVLLATGIGWLGLGFRTWICLPLSTVLLAVSLWANHKARMMAGVAVHTAIFCLVGSLGWLFSIVRFGAFNAYNDAFTYLVQAQWLQTHAFRTPVISSGQYPAFTQVALFQVQGLRMGASFLLGWVQATFGLDWSYLVYPAVVLLPLVASAIALAGMAYFVVRKGRTICMLGGAAIGTTLSGAGFGALFGFLHQTFGIAFAFAGLGLLGMYSLCLRRGAKLQLWKVIPCALPPVALLYCYPEISPFVAVSGLVCLGSICLRRSLICITVDFSIKLTILVLLLLNVEVFRIWHAVRMEAAIVVGTPVAWTPVRFLAHSAGFVSGAWEGTYWTLGSPLGSKIAALLFIAASCSALVVFRRRIRALALIPTISMGVLILLAFLYFRYARSSPWPEGTGQSWSQFKLSNWISVFVLFILVCGAAVSSYGPRWSRLVTVGWLLTWQASGLMWNYRLADTRTKPLRQETGFLKAPFEAFMQIRELSKFAGEAPIFLDLGGLHTKNRQMVAYFLQDHRLASDWSDDGYLLGTLPPSQRTLALEPLMWVLAPADSAELKSKEQRVGRLGFSRAADKRVNLIGVIGGYGEETDGDSHWRWTGDSLQYHYTVIGNDPLRLRGRLTYLPAGSNRKLRISVTDGTSRTLQQLEMQAAWTPFVTAPFEIRASEFSLNFDTAEPPVRLGATDPRMLGFLIKNLSLEVIQ